MTINNAIMIRKLKILLSYMIFKTNFQENRTNFSKKKSSLHATHLKPSCSHLKNREGDEFARCLFARLQET